MASQLAGPDTFHNDTSNTRRPPRPHGEGAVVVPLQFAAAPGGGPQPWSAGNGDNPARIDSSSLAYVRLHHVCGERAVQYSRRYTWRRIWRLTQPCWHACAPTSPS